MPLKNIWALKEPSLFQGGVETLNLHRNAQSCTLLQFEYTFSLLDGYGTLLSRLHHKSPVYFTHYTHSILLFCSV